MTNPQQNKVQNEIEQIKKYINLLQDKLKKLKNGPKRITQTKDGLKQIAKINKIQSKAN